METEKPKEEVKPEEKVMPTFIEAVERMEKANAEAKIILARQEELVARNLLGGRTDAGIQPEKPIELSPREYADLALKGKVGK